MHLINHSIRIFFPRGRHMQSTHEMGERGGIVLLLRECRIVGRFVNARKDSDKDFYGLIQLGGG